MKNKNKGDRGKGDSEFITKRLYSCFNTDGSKIFSMYLSNQHNVCFSTQCKNDEGKYPYVASVFLRTSDIPHYITSLSAATAEVIKGNPLSFTLSNDKEKFVKFVTTEDKLGCVIKGNETVKFGFPEFKNPVDTEDFKLPPDNYSYLLAIKTILERVVDLSSNRYDSHLKDVINKNKPYKKEYNKDGQEDESFFD